MSRSGASRSSSAFTMVELLLAVFLVGVLTTLCMLTFRAVTHGWQVSQDYIDKMQRADYAINQVVCALRSMYYPHDGQQDKRYRFFLNPDDENEDDGGKAGGDGEDPDDSDVIEWSKKGTALVGDSVHGQSVHRVRLMVLEKGNRDFLDEIEVTGLYVRVKPDEPLRTESSEDDDVDLTFKNEKIYQPELVADGIVGFSCRVLKDKDKVKDEKENDTSAFEEEWSPSNQAVPYKLELTFRIEDPDRRSYESAPAPIVRVVRIPIYEQSTDGATSAASTDAKTKGGAAGAKSKGGGGAPPPAGGGK